LGRLFPPADPGRYNSAVKLFVVWDQRLRAAAIRPVMKSMAEMIEAVEKGKIPTSGVD